MHLQNRLATRRFQWPFVFVSATYSDIQSTIFVIEEEWGVGENAIFPFSRLYKYSFLRRAMLSLNKLIVGSWRTSRHVTIAARKSLSVILARSYMAGRNWVAAQGLQMKNNAAELPSSAPFIYPTRKGRCGVIVFHPTSVFCICVVIRYRTCRA